MNETRKRSSKRLHSPSSPSQARSPQARFGHCGPGKKTLESNPDKDEREDSVRNRLGYAQNVTHLRRPTCTSGYWSRAASLCFLCSEGGYQDLPTDRRLGRMGASSVIDRRQKKASMAPRSATKYERIRQGLSKADSSFREQGLSPGAALHPKIMFPDRSVSTIGWEGV